MSEKRARQIRKEFNKLERETKIKKQTVADNCVRELLNAPFKYRFLFAMRIIFHRRKR